MSWLGAPPAQVLTAVQRDKVDREVGALARRLLKMDDRSAIIDADAEAEGDPNFFGEHTTSASVLFVHMDDASTCCWAAAHVHLFVWICYYSSVPFSFAASQTLCRWLTLLAGHHHKEMESVFGMQI